MKKSNLILSTFLGFYVTSLFVDNNLEVMKIKSILFTIGVTVALIVKIIEEDKSKK